jgi:NAD-dependent dihydropyrimidine dehydrogenase PreA subunit
MGTLEYGVSFMAVNPPQMRTIPVHKSIDISHNVATYDQLRAIIYDSPGPFVILNCICREVSSAEGRSCRQTKRLETCLGMNDIASLLIHRSLGREVSREEAIAILHQNEDDGLVLQPGNSQKPEFICSCCGCCCGMLRYQKFLTRPVDFWTSNFYVQIDSDKCTRCGKCVKRCQVKAISMKDPGETAVVNLARCIGCGLCVPTCPAKAIQLMQKENKTTPPADYYALNDEIMKNRKSAFQKFIMLVKMLLKIKQ